MIGRENKSYPFEIQCLAHSSHQINICWVKEHMYIRTGTPLSGGNYVFQCESQVYYTGRALCSEFQVIRSDTC